MSEHRRRSFLMSARPVRYTALVMILIAYVLVTPFTGVGTVSNRLLNLFVLLALLAIVRAAWPSRQMTILTAVLALVALMPTFGVWPDASMPGLTSHMASLLFTTLVITAILSQVLTTEYVTIDTVVGAASVYVLIALLWATIYALLEFWWPGSFSFPGFQTASPTTLVPLMKDTIILYYSFETLTTLGYGDVTPATPPARFFSVAEALVGQLYLAVLVARFVGLQVAHYNSTRPHD
jgi:voltage-gated potassium channel